MNTFIENNPSIPRPSNKVLADMAYDLCMVLDKCPASPETTNALLMALNLHAYLRKPQVVTL